MTPNSVKLLYPIINNSDGYIEESNGNKYLAIVPTDENNDTLKKYEKNGAKLKISLDQQITTQIIMMKNI